MLFKWYAISICFLFKQIKPSLVLKLIIELSFLCKDIGSLFLGCFEKVCPKHISNVSLQIFSNILHPIILNQFLFHPKICSISCFSQQKWFFFLVFAVCFYLALRICASWPNCVHMPDTLLSHWLFTLKWILLNCFSCCTRWSLWPPYICVCWRRLKYTQLQLLVL